MAATETQTKRGTPPSADDGSSGAAPPTEERVAELTAELERVKSDRTLEHQRQARRAEWRRFFSAVLAIVAAVSIVLSLTGLWLQATVLDSRRFASAAAPLVRDDDVARAIGEFTAAEIVTHTDARREIASVLPADAQVLAGPVSSALQDGLALTVEDVIQTAEFQAVFETAVRLAHEEALLILEGDGDVIESKNGLVTINLLAVVNEVLQAASEDLSALLGTTITVPTLSADDIPAEQIAEVEKALGVQLPEDFGQVTLFKSNELADAQGWVHRFDVWLEVFIVVAIASTIGAFALSSDRRRSVITLGLAIPVVTVVTWLIADAGEDGFYRHIDDPTGRAAARAATGVLFAGLDRVAWWTIGLSLAAAAVALLMGKAPLRPSTEPGEGDEPSGDDEAGPVDRAGPESDGKSDAKSDVTPDARSGTTPDGNSDDGSTTSPANEGSVR